MASAAVTRTRRCVAISGEQPHLRIRIITHRHARASETNENEIVGKVASLTRMARGTYESACGVPHDVCKMMSCVML